MFEFSFLNTGLLIFAAATVLPLLIWLLAKRKPNRVVFSTLRFIKLSKEQQKNRTKLNNIILLIIRMLIILLVVLSAARPLLRSDRLKPSKKHPPTAIAIMLDTSFSMDYLIDSKTWLDRAKVAMAEINKRSTSQDRLILITSDETWNNLHAQLYSGSIPEELISNIEITYKPLPLSKMVELAETKLKDSQLQNRELYLISDYQLQDLPEKSEYKINVIPLAEDPGFENLSCSNAKPVPQLVQRSRQQSISYELRNHGNNDRSDVLVKAVVNDVKVAEKFVSLRSNQVLTDVISFEIRNDGWQSGYIEVLDDRLIHDNRSYFTFSYFLNPRIAIISQQSAIPRTLSSLLRVYAGENGKLEILNPSSVSLELLQSYNLIALYDPGAITHRLREVLAGLSQRNVGVLHLLGKDISSEWKSYLKSAFGISLTGMETANRSISFSNKQHYISSLLQADALRRVNVSDYWNSAGNPNGSVLISAGNEALAIAGSNSVLWLWDIGSLRNSFFTDPAFAVFAYRSFQYLGNAVIDSDPKLVGESITASGITMPDGRSMELANQRHQIQSPGIYQIRSATGEISYLAANLDNNESEFVLADYSADKRTRLLSKDWKNQLFFTRMGHDLWKIFLILALVLMACEIIIVKFQEAKPASSKTT